MTDDTQTPPIQGDESPSTLPHNSNAKYMEPHCIIFTDYVDQVCQKAFDQKIKVVEEFHYVLGSFVKIQAPSKQIREFLFDILVFIDSAKAKKPVTS